MQIGKKIFPYPTLNNSKNVSCFKNSRFGLVYEDSDASEDKDYLVLKNAHIELDNESLISLLKDGTINAVVIIECSSTVFRKSYDVSIFPKDIKIPLSSLSEKVVISCFLYATKNFSYINDDFLDDYQGYEFQIEKYDILAIDDGYVTNIEYDESKDKKVSSIFRIIKDEFVTDVIKINEGTKTIEIHMPTNQYSLYDNMKNNDNFQCLFFSILAIPALVYVLQEIKDQIIYEEVSLDEISFNYRWLDSIRHAYKEIYNEELTEEMFRDLDVVEVSQKLMNSSTTSAIDDLNRLTIANIYKGDDDNE